MMDSHTLSLASLQYLSPNFQAVVLHNLHITARDNFLLKTISHILDWISLTEKKSSLK